MTSSASAWCVRFEDGERVCFRRRARRGEPLLRRGLPEKGSFFEAEISGHYPYNKLT